MRGRADIVFRRLKLAVYVDGCFWHLCPEHTTWPKSNSIWWRDKLTHNVERDRQTNSVLKDAGWTVLRFWEHHDPTWAAGIVFDTLRLLHTTDKPD